MHQIYEQAVILIARLPHFFSILFEFVFSLDVLTNFIAGLFLALALFLVKEFYKKPNLNGNWIFYETTQQSDYIPYIGMKIIYSINLLHSGNSITGNGEKISEVTLVNGEILYKKRDKISAEGNFERNIFRKNLITIKVLFENERKISTFLSLKQINSHRLEGTFITEAANSSGTVVFEQKNLPVFGVGFLYGLCVLYSKIFKIRLVDNVEHHFNKYTSRARRLESLKLDNVKKILIAIEDKNFENHKGYNFKSFGRAIFSRILMLRFFFRLTKSGGSTITMQLARTLFIKDYHKTFRRKILEFLFSAYLERILKKPQILNLYLSSVRFSQGVYGIQEAVKYFFQRSDFDLNLTNEQAFLLIERLSSLEKTYSLKRVIHLYNGVMAEKIPLSMVEVKKLYKTVFDSNQHTSK